MTWTCRGTSALPLIGGPSATAAGKNWSMLRMPEHSTDVGRQIRTLYGRLLRSSGRRGCRGCWCWIGDVQVQEVACTATAA